MSHRSFVAIGVVTCVLLVLAASEARAQEQVPPAPRLTATFLDPAMVPPPATRLSALSDDTAAPSVEKDSRPSKLMLPFYVATAALQALDVHSSFSALDAGAAEANPLLLGLVPNRPAFVAVKAGMTVAMIYGASHLAKHHRVYAIIALVGINSAYAALVAHNYHVAAVMRARQR